MIPHYLLLAERLRAELASLEQVVERAEAALARTSQQPQDEHYFLAAAALDLHGFYAGLERLFELIASEVDQSRPSGPRWHRDLLAQMSLRVGKIRPAVLSSEANSALVAYLEFRHVVRNVYAFDLRPKRIVELVRDLHPTFALVRRDLEAFATFLTGLATSDQA